MVELRSKLEIAESTIQEKEALLNDIHQEFEFFKKESRETQRKVSKRPFFEQYHDFYRLRINEQSLKPIKSNATRAGKYKNSIRTK